MKIVASQALIELLKTRRLFTAPQGYRWKAGDSLQIHRDARLEPYSHILAGATIPRALGAFSYSLSAFDPSMRVGRYCSLAHNLAIMGSSHPTTWASNSPFSYDPAPLRGFAAYLGDTRTGPFALHSHTQGSPIVTIGHDVWIGSDVMIKRGVTIGDGAVIGARSVVTRDVPPYAVIGGSPARLIRYRFAEPVIERMLAARWWQYGPDVLLPLKVEDPALFLDQLDAAVAAGTATPAVLPILSGETMIAVNAGSVD